MMRRSRKKPAQNKLAPLAAHLTPIIQRLRRLALVGQGTALALRLVALIVFAKAAGIMLTGGAGILPYLSFALVSLSGAVTASLIAARFSSQAEQVAAREVIGIYEGFAARAPVATAADMPAGELVMRVERHPEACASALVSIPNAKTMASLGALLTLTVIACVHWPSAIVLLSSLPLMIVAMIIVGKLTKRQADRQEEALHKLSARFADKVRCLPTILSADAVARERDRLGDDLRTYRDRAADVLRFAFMNSTVLDAFQAIGIAVLAISTALGILGQPTLVGFAGIGLTQGLIVLVLASEVYAPLRKYAEFYHKMSEGKTALEAVDPLVEAVPSHDARIPAEHFALRGAVSSIAGPYPDITLPKVGLVVISGPSGCGKTCLLRLLAGVEPADYGQVFRAAGGQAWAAADGYLGGYRLRDVFGRSARDRLAALAMQSDPRFADGGDTRIGLGAVALSGGQRLRLSVGAALASRAQTIFCDEPTAKLDDFGAQSIRDLLKEVAQERLVIAASHDRALIAAADVEVALEHRERIAT
ncbi:MAG: ATP-binding cassette domain-containing protein [Pseudomonadota bacterium]